jgi:tripartite-type tricarboxylate transporter receptor subunit TctC
VAGGLDPATPPAVIAEIQRAVNAALADPAIRASVEQQGFEIVGSNARDFSQFMKQESAKWGELIQKAGLKLAD